MITKQLLEPKSIVVIGASNDVQKPGGKVLKNIIDGGFEGGLYVANPKADEVQGVKSYRNIEDLPQVDLAVIAIAAKYTLQTVEYLTQHKETRAFIILSAGFSEESEEGKVLEDKVVEAINKVGGSLIGPNCVGICTPHHHSIFTQPIPKLDPNGVDFISGSGATACFIMESAIPKGLTFSSVWSVGNSAQMGVEEIIKHMDENFNPETDSKVKLLYIETVDKPDMLLKHASSLIRKGCKIAAVKAGSSEAGSRAASSHTGALASSDSAVDALFKKAGIVRCHGRDELITVGNIFMHPELKGKNIAIITHAGGPAVMLTDALSKSGLEIPHIEGPKAEALKEKLFAGSSVANPIDFLATGTAEQLGDIIDACDNDFDNIDAMVVIFGTPGLFPIFDVYDVLDEKMKVCRKPIYPVLPSLITAKEEVDAFISKGRIIFPDEVTLGNALGKVYHTAEPTPENVCNKVVDEAMIRAVIDSAQDGYLTPEQVQGMLDGAGIARAKEATAQTLEEAAKGAEICGFPLVMKVIGPVHKSDVGGVVLNVKDQETVAAEFERMMQIPDTTGILFQPMLTGKELFAGVSYEDKFGHMILCGLGGIYIEVFKDASNGLAPLTRTEAVEMVQSLQSYKIIQGVRGQEGVNEKAFIDIIMQLSALVEAAPEIKELDLNPLLGTAEKVVAVDARIRIEK